MLLGEEASALLVDGLLQDYRSADETLDVLRGRLRVRDQWLRQFGRVDRLECHFDEYDADNAENQLVTASLFVARTKVAGSELRAEMAVLQRSMPKPASLPQLTLTGMSG